MAVGRLFYWRASGCLPSDRILERATSMIFNTKVTTPITSMAISIAVFVSMTITSFCDMISV